MLFVIFGCLITARYLVACLKHYNPVIAISVTVAFRISSVLIASVSHISASV